MRKQALFPLAIAVTLALPVAALAQTLELPTRKSGLWEIITASEQPTGIPSTSQQICVDTATDRDLMNKDLGLIGAKCTKLTTKRQNQTYVIETDCAFGPLSSKAKTVITGDFSSAYSMRMESTMEGAAGVFVTQTAATWKSGDCHGMAPGDIGMLGDKLNVNIKEVKSLLDPSARPLSHLPPRRPGQWEVHSVTEMPGLSPVSVPPSRLCIDPATDQPTMEVALMTLGCGVDIRRVDAEWLLEGKCELGGLKMSTKATISGDIQSTITLRLEQTIEGIGSSPMTTTETRTARWIGPACADGMVPGDIVFPHGQKINVAAPLAELEQLLQGSPPPKDK